MPRAAALAFGLAAALAAAAPASLASAQTLDRVRATGEIRLGLRADAAPLSFLKDGQPAGYTVGVCRRLAERLSERLGTPATPAFVTVTAENRFEKVAAGEIDLLCGAASVTVARREIVDFSIPVFIDGATVAMRRDALTDFRGLAGKRIGVRAGTTTESRLRATLDRLAMSAEVVPVQDHADGLRDLLGGVLHAYFADQSILMGLVGGSDRREELAVSTNVLSVEPQALAMKLGDSEFRRAVDRELSAMYRSGEIAKLFEAAFAPATMGDAMKALVLVAPIPD